ncbi:MAG: hypothetical protein ACI8SE_000742 [Bacteroidia bacterium]|jgi:hypothetical protein
MNRLFNLGVCLLVFYNSVAQNTDSSDVSVGQLLALRPTEKLKIDGDIGLITTFLNNSLISNNYWTDDLILNQVNNLNDVNRFGAFGGLSTIYYSGKPSGLFYGLGYKNLNGGTSQKSILEAILKGNQNQPSIVLDRRNGFEQIGYGYVSLGREVFDTIKNRRIAVALNLYARQQYTKFLGTSGSFEVDSSGEFLDVRDADVLVLQDLSNPFESFGIGITMSYTQSVNDDLWSFKVEDFGVIRSSNMRTAMLNSSFTFDGFDVSSQIDNAGSLQLQDSLNQNFFETDTSSDLRLMPFETSVQLLKSLGNNNILDASLSYVNLVGFYPLLEAVYQQPFKGSKANWRVGAQVGGFGNCGVNLGGEFPFGLGHIFTLNVAGLESLSSDNLPVYMYGKMGLKIQL